MPNGMLQPDVARALDELVRAGYAPSPVAAIAAAITDAHKKLTRSKQRLGGIT